MSLASLRPAALLVAGAGLLVLALAAGSDLAGCGLRAIGVVALLGAGVVALRRGRAVSGSPAALAVLERHLMGKETGIALVTAEERRLVVGYCPAGVVLLTELGAAGKEHVP